MEEVENNPKIRRITQKELLEAVERHQPISIYELAKKLNFNYWTVYYKLQPLIMAKIIIAKDEIWNNRSHKVLTIKK